MDELGNQLGAAVVVSTLLEALKRSDKFRFLNSEDSGKWKAFIGFVTAFLTTIGIHYTFDYNPMVGGKVTFEIPAAMVVFHSTWDFAKQWAFQQFVYMAGIKEKKNGTPNV